MSIVRCQRFLSPRLRVSPSPRLFLFFSDSPPLPIPPSSRLRVPPSPPLPFFLSLDRAQPIRASDIHWQNLQPMALRIFNECEWLIKAHRLVIQNRGRERHQVITLKIGTRIGNQCEACRV